MLNKSLLQFFFSVRLLWSYRNHIGHLEIFASDNLATNSSQGCSQQSTFLFFEENTQIDLKASVYRFYCKLKIKLLTLTILNKRCIKCVNYTSSFARIRRIARSYIFFVFIAAGLLVLYATAILSGNDVDS